MRATARAFSGLVWLGVVVAVACAQGTDGDVAPAEHAGTGPGGGTGGSTTSGGSAAGGFVNNGGNAGTTMSGGVGGAGGTGGGGASGSSGSAGKGGTSGSGGKSGNGGGGTGGTTGAGGAGGDMGAGASPGAGGSGPCATAGDYKVQVWNCNAGDPGCSVRILKSAMTSVALTRFKLKFWISKEESANFNYIESTKNRYYPGTAPYNDGDVTITHSEAAWAPASTGANYAFTFTFSGTKDFGATCVNEYFDFGWYVQTQDYGAPNSNSTNDYSYKTGGHAGTSGAGYNNVALYLDDNLVWGCEPP